MANEHQWMVLFLPSVSLFSLQKSFFDDQKSQLYLQERVLIFSCLWISSAVIYQLSQQQKHQRIFQSVQLQIIPSSQIQYVSTQPSYFLIFIFQLITQLYILFYYLSLHLSLFLRLIMTSLYQKANTFTRSPSFTQIASYIVVSFETVVFYLMIRPNYQSTSIQILFTVLYSFSLFLTIASTAACSCIDPTDSALISYISEGRRKVIDKFNFQDTLYCQTCQSYVTKNAKHCKQCDRCIQNFDHHCIWINNCVGEKNYKLFVLMISSTLSKFSVFIAAVIVLSVEKRWSDFIGFMITSWSALIIVFVFWFLLINLSILHIYLACKGYTTYEFILIKRQEEKREQIEKIQKQLKEKDIVKKKDNIKKFYRITQQNQINHSQQNIGTPKGTKKKTQPNEEPDLKEETNCKIQTFQRKSSKESQLFLQAAQSHNNINPWNQKFHVLESEEKKNQHKQKDQISSLQLEQRGAKSKIHPIPSANQDIQSSYDRQPITINRFFIRNKTLNYFMSNKLPGTPKQASSNKQINLKTNYLTEKKISSKQHELPKLRNRK